MFGLIEAAPLAVASYHPKSYRQAIYRSGAMLCRMTDWRILLFWYNYAVVYQVLMTMTT